MEFQILYYSLVLVAEYFSWYGIQYNSYLLSEYELVSQTDDES